MTMKTPRVTALLATTLLCAAASAASAESFNRIAAFSVADNLPAAADLLTETSPEIIAANGDGTRLYYTDSPLGAVGMIDIADPSDPAAGGVVMVDGEPTSLAVVNNAVYVATNTSESFTEPSGRIHLLVWEDGATSASCDLGGQPDAIAAAADGSFLAIAIENERDEDLNDGEIPQLPPGNVTIVPIDAQTGALVCEEMVVADLTGLAEVAPSDPEPEFVDVNAAGEIVVTLQENNHIVLLSADGTVLNHFSAGEVVLEGIDTEEEGAITFTETATLVREPDAVKWIDQTRFVTANEGDYRGGSRGFTVWNSDGTVSAESGADFEYAVASIGHYPEERSGNKGVEPEGLEVAMFGDTTKLFVLSERGSVVGVYDVGLEGPRLAGLLPSGIGPEGAVAIAQRNLFVTANEADLGEDGGPRAHVMIYELGEDAPAYPTLRSEAAGPQTIAWGALSGLAADPTDPNTLYAVNDSFYALQPTIFTIDASQTPALITAATPVTRGGAAAQKLDLEGIVADGEGGFWLASEGRTDRLVPHALYHVNETGEIDEEIAFPPELLAHERRFGSEGLTLVGDTLWIAIQRSWGDDPDNHVKLVSYNLETEEWGAVRYPTEAAETGWVGLSEITAHGDHVYLIERDNQIGAAAKVKTITRVPLSQMQAAPLGGDLPVVEKELVRDLIPDLARFGGYIVDKVEGLAVTADGTAYVVTDNDGTDDSSGETFFFSVPLTK